MPKSIAQVKEEEARLGRITPQMVAQEDTLSSVLSQLDITLSNLRDTIDSRIYNSSDLLSIYDHLKQIRTQIDSYLSNLDIALSTLYSELSSILTQLDVALSTRASEATLGNIKAKTDNIPSDPAREGGNLATIASQLDITLSALRDALRGASTKDFSTLETDVESIYSKLNAQLDITISALRDALKGASNKDFSTLETELDKKVDEATTPNEYTVTLTSADTEYSQALPAGTKALEFWARESVDIRFAFTSGKVATPTEPYFTLKAGTTYYKENINLTGKTLYLASSVAGSHVEIIAWT